MRQTFFSPSALTTSLYHSWKEFPPPYPLLWFHLPVLRCSSLCSALCLDSRMQHPSAFVELCPIHFPRLTSKLVIPPQQTGKSRRVSLVKATDNGCRSCMLELLDENVGGGRLRVLARSPVPETSFTSENRHNLPIGFAPFLLSHDV